MKYIKRVVRLFVIPVQFLIGMLIFMYGNLVGKLDKEPIIVGMDVHY